MRRRLPRRRQGRRSYLLETIFAIGITGCLCLWYGRALERRDFGRLASKVDDGCYGQLRSAEQLMNEAADEVTAVAPARW